MNTRTNIVLDDDLVARAMERAGVTTKKAAVEAALRAFLREPDYELMLAAEGSGLVADDYEPKAAAPARPVGDGNPRAKPKRRPAVGVGRKR